jgi:hypothetical protein
MRLHKYQFTLFNHLQTPSDDIFGTTKLVLITVPDSDPGTYFGITDPDIDSKEILDEKQ